MHRKSMLVSLLKIPFGQGTGFPTKTSVDDSRQFEQSVHRFCDLSPLQWFGHHSIRARQLRTVTTPGAATAVQVQLPQTVQAARRS